MKIKWTVAAASAAIMLMNPVMASSVNLYGLVDVGVLYYGNTLKTNDASTGLSSTVSRTGTGLRSGISGQSFWGLKGEEDLGNGTKAIFQLESRFDVGNGQSLDKDAIFGRRAIVGLKSDNWGTFTIGRQYNVADDFIAGFDPFGAYFVQAGALGYGGAISSPMNNSLKYMSPVLKGFQFAAAWSGHNVKQRVGDNVDSDPKNKNWISLGLHYKNGPFEAGANWDTVNYNKNYPFELPVTSGGDALATFAATQYRLYNYKPATGWNIGASYDFGVVKLSAVYGQERNGTISGVGGLPRDYIVLAGGNSNLLSGTAFYGLNSNSYMLGASVPVGDKGKFLFSYQGGISTNKEIKFNANYSPRMTVNIYSIGYRHELSKRTSLYGGISRGILNYKNDLGYSDHYVSNVVGIGMTHLF